MSLPISTDTLKLNGVSVSTNNGVLSVAGELITHPSKTKRVDPSQSAGFTTIQAAYDAIKASGVTDAVIQLGVGDHGTLTVNGGENINLEIVGLGALSSCSITANTNVSGVLIRLNSVTVDFLQIVNATPGFGHTVTVIGNANITTLGANMAPGKDPVEINVNGRITIGDLSASGLPGTNGTTGGDGGVACNVTLGSGVIVGHLEANGGNGGNGTTGAGGNGTIGGNITLEAGVIVSEIFAAGGTGGSGSPAGFTAGPGTFTAHPSAYPQSL